MGNSQSSKKSKKKAKKYESDSEAGDEEVEYEEVEVSVYETVHEESSPKSLQKPKLELPMAKSYYKKGNSKLAIPTYDQIKKPIRNATMFARHYAMTLHRLEMSIGFPQENYWLDNLENTKDDNILGISQQSPWGTMIEEKDSKKGQMANKNMPVNPLFGGENWIPNESQNSPHFRQPINQDQAGYSGSQRPMPDYNRNSLSGSHGPQPAFQDNPSARQSNHNSKQGQPLIALQPAGSMAPSYQSTPHSNHDHSHTSHRHTKRVTEKLTDDEKDGKHYYHKERKVEEYDEIVEEDEDDEEENSYIKTTWRQSEPNSEAQENFRPEYEKNKGNDCFCEETNCIDCLNKARGFLSQRGAQGDRNSLRESLRMRDLKLNTDKEAMLENYLEKLVVNKPSNVQKLLVEQYLRPKSNEKHISSVHNRISDALRNRMRSQSREYDEDVGRGSYIVQNLEEQLSTHLRNPEPVLLKKDGLKFIEDGGQRQRPLKLVKFVKEINLYDKGSINYGIANSNYDNKNIAYLTDGYQLKNYIEREKENKKSTVKKSYTNLKSDQLWPKGTKFDRASVTKQLEKNELSRLSREAESVKHTMNYTSVKHHPRNLNYRQDNLVLSSPKWGSPRESHKIKPPIFTPMTSTIPKRVQQVKTMYSEQGVSSYLGGDVLDHSSASHIRNRKDLIRQAIENSDTY